MTVTFIIINLVIMIFFIFGFVFLQRKHVSFSKRVFLALAVGIVFGLVLQFIYGPASKVVIQSVDWFNIVGVGYVKLLQMVVMPLVFISILSAFTRLKLTSNIGKIGTLVIGILLGTTAVAAAIGIGSAAGFQLAGFEVQKGSAEAASGVQLEQTFNTIKDMTYPQKIISLLPSNPFADLTGARPTSTIAVVIFAAILGIAYLGIKRKEGEEAALVARGVEALHALTMRVVALVIRLTPYGVLALITKIGATSDLLAIWKLGKFVIASYVALAVMFIIHLLLLSLFGLNPIMYVKKIIPVLAFAFTSRSSAATLPLNVKTQTKQLGVSEGIANFAGSFGLSIGQNGCAGIYPAMVAVMIAPTVGINPFTPSFILTLIVVVTISSFGVAGVGGGATFASIIVLSTMNLPVALVGLLISVEPLIDMGRTALNVSGAMTAGVITSKVVGELDSTVYRERTGPIEA